jgi:RNA polymerase sigma factor (sigma-70 family)
MGIVKSIYENLSDEHLLIDYKVSNNQQSLATLFLRYSDLVYGVCLKYLKSNELSKDAVMGIYEELYKKLAQQDIENFKSWLYVVTKNYCLIQLRKNKKTEIIEFLGESFMQTESFEHLDSILQKEKDFKLLETCLEELSVEQKKVIDMFYLQQLCYHQIVEATQIDWNKIRSLIQNGRRNLKICMDKNA